MVAASDPFSRSLSHGGTNVRELFRAQGLPVLQNRVYPTAEAALSSPTGDIVLVQDRDTGLVFNQAFDPALLVYDRDYQNEQAVSPVFQAHLEQVVGIVDRHLSGRSLIEVGCGKGYFLDRLRRAGYDATGIDPAYEGDSPYVVQAPFERGLGLSADGIILRHVLEHMQDPVSFLQTIADANDGKGLIYIEVPCFDWICAHRAWFDVFFEHVNYFRRTDFRRMFGRVVDSGLLFGGQYLYVVADLATLRRPTCERSDVIAFLDDFTSGIARTRELVLAAGDRPTAVWGASSKGVIFSNYMRRNGADLVTAIDLNPAKQGRHVAVTGLPIISPAQAMDALPPDSLVFVMNSNYHDEIVAQSRHRFQYARVDHYDV
jgi:SAM-dependent methyltransferase